MTSGIHNEYMLISKNGKMSLKDIRTKKTVRGCFYQALIMSANDEGILEAKMIDKTGKKIKLGAIVFK